MSFALPFALVLSALALPIIALYILKVRLRRISVSTNLFWRQIYDEKPPRSIWQHLRHLLSLLAQLLILLLLVVSVADPFFSSQLLQARRIVIVIDRSASMRVRDVAPSRFDAALKTAHDLVDGLRFRDEFAIVLADGRPEVAIGMTGHIPTLHRVIDEVRVTDGPSDLIAAAALGRQLIGNHPHGQVLVLTDGCSPMTDESVTLLQESSSAPKSSTTADSASVVPSVAYRVVGSAAGNVGITQFQVRRSLVDPIGYEILAAVTNASDKPLTLRLELSLNDLPVDVIPLTLKPEERWSRSLEKTSLAGGIVRAELVRIREGGSAAEASSKESDSAAPAASAVNHLTSDDVAWAILPGREVQRVLIVSPGNLFLQKVFEANPLVEVDIQKELPEAYPADSLVVLHQVVPAVIPAGNVLVIDPVSGCDLWEVGDVIANPIVTEQDQASPLMTHIRLDNVLVPEARGLKFVAPPVTLAGTLSGDAVYAEVKRTNGKCLVLSVNLERSDLAFRTAFPIMVANSLGWFSGQTGELSAALATGGMAGLRIPRDAGGLADAANVSDGERRTVTSLKVTSPSGSVTSVCGTGESASIGPLSEIGIWTVAPSVAATGETSKSAAAIAVAAASSAVDGWTEQQIAVNLANEKESDVRTPESALRRPTSPTLGGLWFSRPIWFYLIVAAVLLVAIEWFLYQRRLIT